MIFYKTLGKIVRSTANTRCFRGLEHQISVSLHMFISVLFFHRAY